MKMENDLKHSQEISKSSFSKDFDEAKSLRNLYARKKSQFLKQQIQNDIYEEATPELTKKYSYYLENAFDLDRIIEKENEEEAKRRNNYFLKPRINLHDFYSNDDLVLHQSIQTILINF